MPCNSVTYAEWCEKHSNWTIANLTFPEDAPYDVSALAPIFDTYYAPYNVVDPRNDFATELQLNLDLVADRLARYYNELDTFVGHEHTVMTNEYGERHTNDKGYEYPIAGTNVSPNVENDATTDETTDTTTVTKETDPFKHLDDMAKIKTFAEYFIDQFKDCFTLACALTW